MTGKHADNHSDSVPTITEQREELAETVAALTAKADVSIRVQDTAAEKIQTAKKFASDSPEVVAGSTAAAVVLVVLVTVLKRRRSRRRFQDDVRALLVPR